MSIVGVVPAAIACAYWARPISPPSGQTAALLDMFCALNGATWTPRLENRRQSPATSVLLPTEEAVPWTISTRARLVILSRELGGAPRLSGGAPCLTAPRTHQVSGMLRARVTAVQTTCSPAR